MLSSKNNLLRYRDNEHGKIMTKAVRLFFVSPLPLALPGIQGKPLRLLT